MCMVQVSNTLWAGLFGTLLGFQWVVPVLVVQEPGAKEKVIFWNTRVNHMHPGKPKTVPLSSSESCTLINPKTTVCLVADFQDIWYTYTIYLYIYVTYNLQLYIHGGFATIWRTWRKTALGSTHFAGNDFLSVSIFVFRKWWTMMFAAFGSPIGITSSPWVLQVIGNGPPWMQWQRGSAEATWENILHYVVRLRAWIIWENNCEDVEGLHDVAWLWICNACRFTLLILHDSNTYIEDIVSCCLNLRCTAICVGMDCLADFIIACLKPFLPGSSSGRLPSAFWWHQYCHFGSQWLWLLTIFRSRIIMMVAWTGSLRYCLVWFFKLVAMLFGICDGVIWSS